ncbi:dnaJ homolog subfamily C member 22 [Numida meleagris]|uniref:dnaJ homolog subfamily C member 22 n=1 Tax=Numida meleagris TaxID=8996 RepID=UPI000B3E23DE|nr:dnaJ homolog subfamily C member 22 [Numida meleagris]
MAKRLLVAYGLWALGGPLGLHHLYLGRDSHALLWMLTLGGFGAGWLSDLWHLRRWVAMANGTGSRRGRAVPALSPIRLAGQVAVGTYFGLVAALALPWVPQLLAQPLAVGLGVLLVASVGEQSTEAHRVLTAAFLTSLLFQAQLLAVLPSSLAAGLAAQRHCRYQHPAGPPLRLRARLFRLGMAYLAFAVPVGYGLLRGTAGALGWVGAIPMWSFQGLARLLGLRAGPGGCNERQQWAYQVLGIPSGSGIEEVQRSYRELVKVWHPDHNRQRAEEAEQRFIELQEAYEALGGPRRAAAGGG